MPAPKDPKKYAEYIKRLSSSHKGYEIDIYLPEKKLAFEFNGEYWHGPKFPKTVARDFWKQEHAKDLGVQIYFIWESDWKSRRKECEDFIKEVL